MLKYLGPGEIFGESGFMNAGGCSFSYVCDERSTHVLLLANDAPPLQDTSISTRFFKYISLQFISISNGMLM